ncbi:MAG: hypothetical protein HKN03_12740 [Acidimicrobiales bacterium]|nr:hypothetical protein [Acidimicrobiales bacterium]
MQKKWLVGAAIALVSFVVPVTAAGADPKPGLEVILNCDGEIVYVSVAGNGRWTPAHDLNSTLVGVPIAFGEFNGIFTPTDGSPVEEFTDPPFAKPNAPRSRNQTFDCTYTVEGSFPDGTFSGNGSVTLIVPSSVRF